MREASRRSRCKTMTAPLQKQPPVIVSCSADDLMIDVNRQPVQFKFGVSVSLASSSWASSSPKTPAVWPPVVSCPDDVNSQPDSAVQQSFSGLGVSFSLASSSSGSSSKLLLCGLLLFHVHHVPMMSTASQAVQFSRSMVLVSLIPWCLLFRCLPLPENS